MRRLPAYFSSLLKIYPGEGSLVLLLAGMMILTAGGRATGGASIDALFFNRFGVASLPTWYVALGFANLITLLFVAGLLGRVDHARLYLLLPILLALFLLVTRLLLLLEQIWVYPVLYVGKEVLGSLQAVFLWGLAGMCLEPRQARRLYPLLMAGIIAGTMLGAFGAPLLINTLGAEAQLLVWSVTLALTAWLCFILIRRSRMLAGPPAPDERQEEPQAQFSILSAVIAEARTGLAFVSKSRLLRLMALTNLLFSVLGFSLLLPFSRASTLQYPDANQLAIFFSLFQGAWTTIALLVSLLFTNRLLNRIGVINAMLIYPFINLAGFVSLFINGSFGVITGVRLIQTTFGQSIGGTAWLASFTVVPEARRDQASAFMDAVPGQLGTILNGLILIVGEQTFQPQELLVIGVLASVFCIRTLWKMKAAYAGALSEALHSGQLGVFYNEEEPFGGFQHDPAAMRVLMAGMSDPDAGQRRLAAEILGHLPGQANLQLLLRGLDDPDAEVRLAHLESLQNGAHAAGLRTDMDGFIDRIIACLSDTDADVRCQAVRTLHLAAAANERALNAIQERLQDPDPSVLVQAALAMVQAGKGAAPLTILFRLSTDAVPETRQHALHALAECGPFVDMRTIKDALAVEIRGAQAPLWVAKLDRLSESSAGLAVILTQALGDSNSRVRSAAAEALGKLGEGSYAVVLDALYNPAIEENALLALENFPARPMDARLRRYINARVQRATLNHARSQYCWQRQSERSRLLLDSLEQEMRRQTVLALRAFGLADDRKVIGLVIQGLQSYNPAQTAYALESLESAEESSLIRPLLQLWEKHSAPATSGLPLRHILDDPDAWLRACAALAASDYNDPELTARLAVLARTDPDDLVRAAARSTLAGDQAMQTLSTLTIMERILFLRNVPLFSDLAPVDLKHIATVGIERLFADGDTICHQGDVGDELYIIVSGMVRVVTDTGREMGIRKAGEYVGEMAILSRAPRMSSLVASGDVRLLCLSHKEFEAIIVQRPEVSLAVIRVLCDLLRQQGQR